MVTFSIVVPVHNVAGYVAATLDSIVSQHARNIQVVVVDDCSTDVSGAICDRYADNCEYVRVIHLDRNQGVAAARNHALAAATGDYVVFVDGDDCLIEGALERLTQRVQSLGDVDIVIGRFQSESKVLSNAAMFLPGATGKLDAELVLRHLTQIDYYVDHCWPYAIKRDLIVRNNVRFINSTIAEDAEFIVHLLVLASSMAFCEGDLYLYRERDGSLKNSEGIAPAVSFLRVAHAMRQVMASAGRSEVQKAFLAAQIRHTLGVFRARLVVLGKDDLREVPAHIGREQFPPEIGLSPCGDMVTELHAYRALIEQATLELVADAKSRPLFIYCTGPSSEAVIRSLQSGGYSIRRVIDDNEALNGRSVLGVPISGAAHFSTLTADQLSSLFVVVCIQKKAAYENICRSLMRRGITREQIVHRMF
jgi:Glycosyl transferase family 2